MLESPEHVAVGLVQYLHHGQVLYHPGVVTTTPSVPPEALLRLTPFLCVRVNAKRATWVRLTMASRRDRLLLRSEWRWGGSNAWRSPQRGIYLADGAEAYAAPLRAWVALSLLDVSDEHTVGVLSPDGLDAVARERARQRRRAVPWRRLDPPEGYVGPTGLVPGGTV